MTFNQIKFWAFALAVPLLVSGCLAQSSADEDYHPGIGVPRLSISVSSSDTFDTIYVGQTTDSTLSITNVGSATAVFDSGTFSSSHYTFKDGTFPGTGGTCGSSLNSGLTCTVVVTYIPQSTATETGTATLSYRNSAGGSVRTSQYALSASATAGTSAALDTETFGSGTGVTTNNVGPGVESATAVALDGRKIVSVGFAHNGTDYDFAVARYLSDGSLDTTFDTDGMVMTPIGSGEDRAFSVAITSDGKIVTAGYTHNGSNYDFAVVRYLTDGSLDTGFSSDGIAIVTFTPTHDYGRAVAIQTDGKIVVAGYSTDGGSYSSFTLARLNTDGSLDTSFSSDGKVLTEVGSNDLDYADAIAIQSDGKILVAGYASNATLDFAVVRYNTDGSLDTGFSADGIVTTAVGINNDQATSIAVQSDGKIVLAGASKEDSGSDDRFAIVRYNTDGSLDTTFDTDGKVTTQHSSDATIYAVAIQSDGKIITMGVEGSIGVTVTLARYNTDGSLDTSFSTDGIATPGPTISAVSGAHTLSRTCGATLQSDDKLVVVGGSGTAFRVGRIWL